MPALGSSGAARGDLVTMEWTRDRFADAIDGADRTRIDTDLLALSDDVQNEDLAALSSDAASLRHTLASLKTVS